MEVTTRQNDGVLIAELTGKLDTSTSGSIQDKLVQCVKDGETKIILNLKGLEYVSSAGLRVILIISKLLQSNQGEFRVCSPNGIVEEVLKISGFNSLLRIFDTEKDAIDSINT
jgi:anti-anti-sigma factor